jgi:hypothetical protein
LPHFWIRMFILYLPAPGIYVVDTLYIRKNLNASDEIAAEAAPTGHIHI